MLKQVSLIIFAGILPLGAFAAGKTPSFKFEITGSNNQSLNVAKSDLKGVLLVPMTEQSGKNTKQCPFNLVLALKQQQTEALDKLNTENLGKQMKVSYAGKNISTAAIRGKLGELLEIPCINKQAATQILQDFKLECHKDKNSGVVLCAKYTKTGEKW